MPIDPELEKLPALPHVAEASMTIDEFCLNERISRATYFKMAKAGNGPETLRVPGLAIVRITAEARQAWKRRMAALKGDPALQEKKKERVEISSRAGKLGGAPRHKNPRRRARGGVR